jgi:hypothetical protein
MTVPSSGKCQQLAEVWGRQGRVSRFEHGIFGHRLAHDTGQAVK